MCIGKSDISKWCIPITQDYFNKVNKFNYNYTLLCYKYIDKSLENTILMSMHSNKLLIYNIN